MASLFKTRGPNAALTQLVAQIRPRLREYLEGHGVLIEENGRFLCINPEHDDTSPSMHFVRGSNEERIACWACKSSFDIYGAHAILEGKPKSGAHWVTMNLLDLAAKFGFEIPEYSLSEHEQLQLDVLRLYETVSNTLIEMCTANPDKYLVNAHSRGLATEYCLERGVGSIPWSQFAQALKNSGVDLDFAKEYDVSREMFNDDRLTITIRDQHGTVVGFTRRYMPYDKETEKLHRAQKKYYPAKYHHTSAKVPIFKSNEILFGLDVAKAECNKRLDIFEGHISVLSAQQAGYLNCACQAGTSLTTEQILAAQSVGFRHINLVYDDDPPGYEAARKTLQEFSWIPELLLTVTFLQFPEETEKKDRDPDAMIRDYGLDHYLAFEPITAFGWALADKTRDVFDPWEVASELIAFITAERDRIRRGKMIAEMATTLGVAEDDIRDEIKRRENTDIDHIIEDLDFRMKKAKRTDDRVRLVRQTVAVLDKMETKVGVADVSFEESLTAFRSACLSFKQQKVGLLGYKTGWKDFDDMFDGMPKKGSVFGIAGAANCGKSAWVTALAIRLLMCNPDEVTVIYHIMDDPRPIAFAKIISGITGIPILSVQKHYEMVEPSPAARTRYERAEELIRSWMERKMLLVKGQEYGVSTGSANDLIKSTSDLTGRAPIYIGDSLHNLEGDEWVDERIGTKRVVEWAQSLADTEQATCVFTLELSKAGLRGRPHYEQCAETAKIAYAFKAIGMAYNELHDLQEEAKTFWMSEATDPITGAPGPKIKRPVMELNWEKNKVTPVKGTTFWKFWNHCATVSPLSMSEVRELQRQAKEEEVLPNAGMLAALPGAMPFAPEVADETQGAEHGQDRDAEQDPAYQEEPIQPEGA